ncbi:MAG: LysM peptidoglycan-binding domain-containing M23 family metallopeptidase [Candidatus Promineifilaceae bacterium]|nr:LysM peptidoglycan-binding domain-containing M23 family metallopeptidase [Candidatus Promineifilaceae bacterium]
MYRQLIVHRRFLLLFSAFLLFLHGATSGPHIGQAAPLSNNHTFPHVVEAGDTWTALSYRYGTSVNALQAVNPHPNPLREPTVGATVQIPTEPDGAARAPQVGKLQRPMSGGLLLLAARTGSNPWVLAHQSGLPHPGRPLFYHPVFIFGGNEPPRDLPLRFQSLELSRIPAQPGQALGFRAHAGTAISVTARLDNLPLNSFVNDGDAGDGVTHVIGIGGTGAFFGPGAPELSIRPAGQPLWSQPWRFVDDVWDYDQVTLTGAAAEIDRESILAERARLFEIWSLVSGRPLWEGPFQVPIENYVALSSNYGARRSYNGGPYSTYHEGVDYAAYAGTPVYAPAAGRVVLAEMLYVRGGAVIIDHGLGVYSGFYHMSVVHAEEGQQVEPGDLLGEVGTTGFSSGNHLHWDLLVAETWVDAAAWREQGMACWILEGWGQPCE